MATGLAALVLLCAVACNAAQNAPQFVPKSWRQIQAPPPPLLALPQAERLVLANGLVVLLLPDADLPLVELAVTVRAGQVHEPDGRAGLATLTAEGIRSGGPVTRPGAGLDQVLEEVGGEAWCGAEAESTNAGFSCPREYAYQALAWFADTLQRPAFPPDQVEAACQEAHAQLARRTDPPAASVRREFLKVLFRRKDGQPHPYGRQAEHATLEAIRREDLVEFHRAFFRPERCIVSLTGDFSRAEALAQLQQAFGAWSSTGGGPAAIPELKRSPDARTFWVERAGLRRITFRGGCRLDLQRDHASYPALLVLSELLTHRLSAPAPGGAGVLARPPTGEDARGSPPAGTEGAMWSTVQAPPDGPGFFCFGGQVRPEQFPAACASVRQAVAALRDAPPDEGETAAARQRLGLELLSQLDTTAKLAARLRAAEQCGQGAGLEPRLYEALGRVTPAEVRRVSAAFLDPGRLVLVGTGPTPAVGVEGFGRLEVLNVAAPDGPPAPLVLDPAREARGRQLLAEALEAAGGLAAFQALHTLRGDLVFHTGSYQLRAVLRVALPDRFRADVAGPLGAVTQIVTPDESWQASGPWVKAVPTPEARKNLRALTMTDLGILRLIAAGQEGYNVQALEPRAFEDHRLEGVLLEAAPLGRLKLYFDERTKLLTQVHYTAENATGEAVRSLSGHARFGPLTLARRLDDNDPKAKTKTVEMLALQANPPLEDALFEKPQHATAPPPLEP